MRVNARTKKFVRALMPHGAATLGGGSFIVDGDRRKASLSADEVRTLITAGVLLGDSKHCRPSQEARAWLRREMLDADAFAAQHRAVVSAPDGATLNLAESPLARLANATDGGAAFLARHQVEAGERVQRLAERAQLRPRVTMSYSAAHTAGGKGTGYAADISLMAAEARKELGRIVDVLPRDCAGVVMDVCALLKGLQQIETERRWPRRSAKLVLRIGLEQLAQHFGLGAEAVGTEGQRARHWRAPGARPHRFGD